MKQIEEILKEFKRDWAVPKTVTRDGYETFPLFCFFEDGIPNFDSFAINPPNDVKLFWSHAGRALLFKDAKYGQWGLEILAPEASRDLTNTEKSKRADQFSNEDLLIGKFIGDSELLLVNCDHDSTTFGSILIANPILKRQKWIRAAASFNEFLDMYLAHEGAKYWEKF